MAFGYATPIGLDDLQSGMLLTIELQDGERVVCLVHDTEHDRFFVVLWSSREGEVPRAVDVIDPRRSVGRINGRLEIEPDGPADAFLPPQKPGATKGFIIGKDGRLGVAVDVDHWGKLVRTFVDLETGNAMKPSGAVAILDNPRLFIAQDGRRDRFPLLEPHAVSGVGARGAVS